MPAIRRRLQERARRDVEIDVPETTIELFREQNFAKYQTGLEFTSRLLFATKCQRVGLNLVNGWKSFRYNPGMFKVRQRQVVAVGKGKQLIGGASGKDCPGDRAAARSQEVSRSSAIG
jgi:hypothetical protein